MSEKPANRSFPNYIRLFETGELANRVQQALAGLKSCRACPWECDVDRLTNETKVCRTGRYARVSSYFAHFGEEDCLRGWKGSGTIFFSWCNLHCVFCQNHDISQAAAGAEVSPAQIAAMMIELQNAGCHNINFVTPEHIVPQILEAIPIAIRAGLNLPIVYNTGGYDSLESLRLMDGIVDIYMPDFKYWSPAKAKRFLKAENYPDVAQAAFKEMHRQVGPLQIDESGLARRGLLVRHLVMPGETAETREIMRFLANELSPDTYVNIMAQYHPDGKVGRDKYSEINRRVTPKEMESAYRVAAEAGLHRFDIR
ncbi:MAG: radical SAM protein [Candidatus Latescibacteria bacterium]|nr:radical SAM protein [Candidatus Latescibacterota bacterium]NIO28352.1 radical SAM protein [Candidatus Latescibacterota bacterium]NIO55900.1 radical SAM protein [Candidatus Latescibacterota bacterium]NIT01865.1 radical SAM protein [Candidatus Latescibacterota bacterium]